jgi:hypothetical protein
MIKINENSLTVLSVAHSSDEDYNPSNGYCVIHFTRELLEDLFTMRETLKLTKEKHSSLYSFNGNGCGTVEFFDDCCVFDFDGNVPADWEDYIHVKDHPQFEKDHLRTEGIYFTLNEYSVQWYADVKYTSVNVYSSDFTWDELDRIYTLSKTNTEQYMEEPTDS